MSTQYIPITYVGVKESLYETKPPQSLSQDAIEKRLKLSQQRWREKRGEEKEFFVKREEGKRKIEEIEENLVQRGDEETLEKFRTAKEQEYQEER